MKRLFLLAGLMWIACLTAMAADIKCTGTVIDEFDDPMPGASVSVPGTNIATATDIDGNFKLSVPESAKTIRITFVGYKTMELKPAADMGTIKLEVDAKTLSDVVVTQSIGKTRETPVAMSTISAETIEFKLGNQELLEVLKTTPGVYTRSEGGGYGDAKTRMRGFQSENVAMLINGIPVNDMEWGGVYMSNWANLSDVASSIQTQRGLGATIVSTPSIGGTINITTRTIEVTMGRIYDYKVNYSSYLQLRQERRVQQQKAFDEQQKMIAETREFIERFKGTYSKTLQVPSRVKMLEKLEILEVDEEDTSALRLKFPPSPRSGTYPVIIENVAKTYGDHTVFRNANLMIERGDKIAFVGKNGEGKSTLVKCIMKEIEHDGTLTIGHNVMIGYFAQNQASLLDENLTVFQTIDDVAQGDIRNKIKDLLGAFMFGGENSAKKVKVLSGGERTRLAMIKLLLEPVNLLILDEPTNHLDMKTKDILKQALLDFDGTLIVVSHDRDFLDGLVTKVYEFGNQRVTEHLEGIYEFLQRKKMENLNELERNKTR